MVLPRDRIRDRTQQIVNEGIRVGLNIDDERSRENHTERSLRTKLRSLINDQAPSRTRERLLIDAPPEGLMDGANTTFTLSDEPVGENIQVVYHSQATNSSSVLARSDSNPPPPGAFYWNRIEPFVLVVGTPPVAGDGLFAIQLPIR